MGALLEMGRFDHEPRAKQHGAITMVLDSATALETVSLLEVWEWAVHEGGVVVEPLQTTTAIFTGSKWTCLLFRIVWQHALSEVLQAYPPVKMQGCVDEIAVCVEGKNCELPENCV